MAKTKLFFVICIFVVFLTACQEAKTETPASITVNETVFTVEQINDGIKEVFNKQLYYNGAYVDSDIINNKKLVLNKTLTYELFFAPSGAYGPAKIYFAITNVEHPLSTPSESFLYEFGIDITELGLCSEFSYIGRVLQGQNYNFVKENTVSLGSHSLTITSVEEPKIEQMSEEWKTKAEKAIRLYMDENDFCSNKEENLPSGKYTVYVEGFRESDTNSVIVFENENGVVYSGYYYFVHHVSDNAADLNHVEPIGNSDDTEIAAYLDALRSTHALKMEYRVD